MTTRTIVLTILMALAALAAAPAVGRVLVAPAGPPPPADLPGCQFADLPAQRTGYHEWADTLLDTRYRLPADYEPPDLLLAQLSGRRVRLREFVVPHVRAMLEAARADGVTISVTSAYRSHSRQAWLFEQVAGTDGEEHARLAVARAGHSEHQLGTAIDLKGGSDWLRENAWRFGFVLSYPAGRSPAWTCYMPEPWHYRYFGRERAEAIHESGLSPREWLWSMDATKPVAYTSR